MTISREINLDDPLFLNVKTPLFIDAVKQPPHWAHDVLLAWDQEYVDRTRNFMTAHYYTGQGTVNIFRVVGTSHPEYQGISWLDLLVWKGKRMGINLPLQEKNPTYYDVTALKTPMMYFNTLDGLHFYVGADGNHRSCIARFYFQAAGKTELHGVTVNHYQIDEAFYQCYCALQQEIRRHKLDVSLESGSTICRREDSGGWKIDYFEPYLIWEEYDEKTCRTTQITLNKQQAQNKLHQLQHMKKNEMLAPASGFWARLFTGLGGKNER